MSDTFIIHESNEKQVLFALHCSEKLTIEESASKVVREGSLYFTKHRSEIHDYLAIPFFDALVADFENETIDVDMEKARLIAQDMIREERKPVLERLDIEYMKASEFQDSATMAEVAAKKQLLRDLPASPAIQEATTPEELEHLARNSVREAIGE